MYFAFGLPYSFPFLLAERVDLPCSYTLFLKISELSQQKFNDTGLAMLEKVLLLMMPVRVFHIPSQCSCSSKAQ